MVARITGESAAFILGLAEFLLLCSDDGEAFCSYTLVPYNQNTRHRMSEDINLQYALHLMSNVESP